MHVFFSYIGGGGIGPLAMIAKKAGYQVSGSDKKNSSPYLKLLKEHGIKDIGFGVSDESIKQAYNKQPIDWYVYSSAVEKEYPNHPEFEFCRQKGIRMTKRDVFLSELLDDKGLRLVAVAGTHGKTTTTAMAIWLFKQLGMPVSYSVGTKLSFGDMGDYDPQSRFFIYECDEFDRNFLAFSPYISMITGIGWDHHEIYPDRRDYYQSFSQFLNQSQWRVLWQTDVKRIGFIAGPNDLILSTKDPLIENVKLLGLYNRRDGFLVAKAVNLLTKEPLDKLLNLLSNFPGLSRRFEKIAENLYSDYAHTPEKIVGAMSVALETRRPSQKIVVVYEPLTNRRMHYTRHQHRYVFKGADKIYWVPSHLAREDPNQPILTPRELIKSLDHQYQSIAQPAKLDDSLKNAIARHLADGDLVLCLSGGGADSLDEWLRTNFKN